jgi:hypothetical protein
MNEKPEEKIPMLYATENIPCEKKMIYLRYEIKELGFYWLIAELDKKKNLAFGYANLNDDELAEWGYMDIDELLDNGADLDREWKPCMYKEAMDRIVNERKERRSMSLRK